LNKKETALNRVLLIQKHFPKKEVRHQLKKENSYVHQEAGKQNANTVVFKGDIDLDKIGDLENK
jgi:hypothetical protein